MSKSRPFRLLKLDTQCNERNDIAQLRELIFLRVLSGVFSPVVYHASVLLTISLNLILYLVLSHGSNRTGPPSSAGTPAPPSSAVNCRKALSSTLPPESRCLLKKPCSCPNADRAILKYYFGVDLMLQLVVY
jgi:hypothetical protein